MRKHKVLYICIGLLTIAFIFANAFFYSLFDAAEPSWFFRNAKYIYVAAVFAVSLIYFFILDKTAHPLPKDPEKRFLKMTALYEEGCYGSLPLKLGDLSMMYYTKGDSENALKLVREAIAAAEGKGYILIKGSLRPIEIFRLNEVTYLTELDRFDEAAQALAELKEDRYKDGTAQYIIFMARAKIAIGHNDAAAARGYLSAARGFAVRTTPQYRANTDYAVVLIEAKCDVLEGNPAQAITNLDDIIKNCEWPPMVRRAEKIKNSIVSAAPGNLTD